MGLEGAQESRGRILGKALLAAGIFAVFTPWILRPWFLAADLLPTSDLSLGIMEDTDLYLNVWILTWLARAVVEVPTELFGGNIFFPAPNVIAGSENMLAHLPWTAPIWLFTGQALAVFKAMVLESFVLSGLAMWAFVYFHTRNFAAALLAGAAFTLAPWRVHNIPHPQYLGFQYLPLALLGVDLWLGSRRFFGLFLLAAGLALQALACLYLGYFTFLAVPVYGFVRLFQTGEARVRRAVGLLLAGLVGALLAAPVALPYIAARDAGMIAAYQIGTSGDWSFEPWWYLGAPFAHRVGIPLLLLVVTDFLLRTITRARGGRLPGSRVETALWILILVAVWLSAGPDPRLPNGIPLPTPYGFLQAIVPGFAELRGPGRFFMVAAAGLAALSGFAARRLLFRASRVAAAVFTTVGLVAFAVAAAPRPASVLPVDLGAEMAPVYRWLAATSGDGAVLELPAAVTERDILGDNRNGRYMLASTAHWRPLLNGVTGHNPAIGAFYAAIHRRLPDPEALAVLARVVDAEYIIVHRDEFRPYRAFEEEGWAVGVVPGGLSHVARFTDADVFRIDRRSPSDWREILDQQMAGTMQTSFDGVSTAPLAAICRKAVIDSVDAPRVIAMAPVPLVLPVVFRNESSCPWPGLAVQANGLVGLTYRWTDPAGRRVLYPPPAFSPLIADVAPGERVTSSVVVQPVGGADGIWTLEIDLVQSGQPEPLARYAVRVEARSFAAQPAGPDPLPSS